MKKIVILLGMCLMIAFFILVPKGAFSAEVTLQHGVNGYNQGRDTFITELWDGDDNLGGYEDLECGLSDVDDGRILVNFGLSGVIPAGATILEARLELYNFDGEYDDTAQERSAYRMTADWIEGTGTKDTIFDETPDQSGAYWGHSGYTSWTGGVFDDTLLDRVMFPARPGTSTDAAWFSWTITDAVRAWYNETAPNYGIILVGDGVGEWTVHYFRSNEYTEPTLRPRLVITYTSDGTNVDPTCDAGTYVSHREGTTVDLTGTASDVNTDPLTYLWTQVSGPSITIQNATSLTASFVAPEVDADGSVVVLSLAVDDGQGGTCSSEASISIHDSSAPTAGMVIDHTCTDLSEVPSEWIQAAKDNLHIVYQHTSHGSQLITGMDCLMSFPAFGDTYGWSDSGAAGALDLDDYGIPGCEDLSQGDWIDEHDVTPWVTATRDLLNNPANSHVNVVMWSWCSINGHNAQRYVDNMEILISEYPDVTFVFMTGHSEGQGEDLSPDSVHYNNQLIRQHCIDNNRILFDFADIEAYDPDGTYFWDQDMYDNLDYSGGNWAQQWITAHPGSELAQLTTGNGVSGYDGCSGCAHSDNPPEANLNCVLKGRAAWYMLARIAGWEPEGPVAPNLSLNPTSLTFTAIEGGADPADQGFTVTNDGGGELTYTISDDADWLSVSPTDGTSAGESDTISVSVNIGGLGVGSHNGTITVNAPGAGNSPAAVHVSLTVSPESPELPGNLLSPSDLVYLGAFRLPDREPDANDAESWEYGGEALAYRPDGDPGGEADGYPGSLFGTGNGLWNYVSEISIPAPSLSRNLEDLNVAATIQDFHDVRGGIFEVWTEMPRIGMEYLPAQGDQTSPKLYLAFGQHLHGEDLLPTHGWCEVDLSSPNTAGGWYIGNESLYNTTGYLFTIPQAWADVYTGGATLAVGRYRDGGLSGTGPSLYAYAPWLDGNPPDPNTHLNASKLLLYSSHLNDPTDFRMDDYRDPDEWEGGAWITAGDKTAVVFTGTKATGPYWWYGFYSPAGDGMPCVHTVGDIYCFNTDGTECAPELTGDCAGHVVESRGWWSS
ncbi:MAG: DNRLRE domain-containing protein, partial [bacterium]